VYTLSWAGEVPAGFEVVLVPVKALTNARRYEKFTAWVARDMQSRPVDRVIGFNKMPGLDVYFAADPCYEEKAQTLRNPLYRFSGRYRHFSAYERAVFSAQGKTDILMISQVQQPFFEKHYATPAKRFHLLPPGIAQDRRAPLNAAAIRAEFRAEFALADDDLLLLQVGSGFKTKGLDRSLLALAHLPDELRRRTRLIAIGQDEPTHFQRMARSLGVGEQVSILQGRSDIPRFLLGADLLVHPAYNENTGTVLLEALVAGLPVLASAVCGYAHYIEEAEGGRVIPEPFEQPKMDQMLQEMLVDRKQRQLWHENALCWAETADIYSNAERAADIILGERR
jgi:UDP-glucose:(heptosyl)LPS alpha-1,3-glucosyltransferase